MFAGVFLFLPATGFIIYYRGVPWRRKKEDKMRRIHRKLMRRVKRHHRKPVSFIQAIRLYLGMPA